jgi:PAS domain S-box-containing protein
MAKRPTHGKSAQMVKDVEKKTDRRKTVEETSRESEEGSSQLLEGSPIPTLVINNKHIVTHCNRAYENLTGIAARTIIGSRKHWMTFYRKKRPIMADFIVDNASEETIAEYYGDSCRKSTSIEGAYEAEGFFPNLGEHGKYVFCTAAPLRDAEGNIVGAIATLQDITERKRTEDQLRTSERRLRTLFYFVPYPTVVFTLDGLVSYLNPAFTETFGWTLEELEGKRIPYVPPGFEQQTVEKLRELFEEKKLVRDETKRLTKDGRILDVEITAAIISESGKEPSGELVMLRDITQEKRMARTNESMLRISMALPAYPDLEDLLDYISSEVRRFLNVEVAIVILLDEGKHELYFLGAAYEDKATQKKAKEVRYPADKGVSGKVIKTGESIIVPDTSKDLDFYPVIDAQVGHRSRNLLEVPLRIGDRIIGVLGAINKIGGAFDQTDVDLLNMIGGTVALSVENARVSEELKKSYRDVTSLNRAKDRVINHLSHELKTPVAVLSGSLKLLTDKLAALPEETWKATLERARRNLERIMDIQYEVADIMQDREYKTYGLLSVLLDQCTDELDTLAAEEGGEVVLIEHIRKRVEEIFGPKKAVPQKILLIDYVGKRLDVLKPLFSHRHVEIVSRLEPTPPVFIPVDILQKVIDGLVKNAIENTPDEGIIEIMVRKKWEGTELVIQDRGVGIVEEAQHRIFEGFFATQETMDYSSRKPFDFNAGGKGADLLRMKIFSERYHFTISIESSRCRFIPKESDICPGRISECAFCTEKEDCYHSGGTTFVLYFPPAPEKVGSLKVTHKKAH